jgi:hypothetical protein
MTLRTLTLSACLLASLTAMSLTAAQNFDVMSIAGNITVTQNTLDWADVHLPLTALLATVGGGDSAGWFSSLDGTTITIDRLNRSSMPEGPDFVPDAFIGFDADPTRPTPGIDCTFGGIDPASACSASPPAQGDDCTQGAPLAPGGSPSSFAGNPGTACDIPIHTTANWVLAGTMSDGETWPWNFSATFDDSFQTALSVLPADASIITAFADTLTATAKLEPDGGYMLGSGFGLILLSVGSRRLFGKRQTK